MILSFLPLLLPLVCLFPDLFPLWDFVTTMPSICLTEPLPLMDFCFLYPHPRTWRWRNTLTKPWLPASSVPHLLEPDFSLSRERIRPFISALTTEVSIILPLRTIILSSPLPSPPFRTVLLHKTRLTQWLPLSPHKGGRWVENCF